MKSPLKNLIKTADESIGDSKRPLKNNYIRMKQKYIKTTIWLLALLWHTSLLANVLNDDKPGKTNTVEEAPNNNSLTNAKLLLNKKLSNSLDKALFEATKGLANKDYSLLPAKPIAINVSAAAAIDREDARKLFDEITAGNKYIERINRENIVKLPQGIIYYTDEERKDKSSSITVGISEAKFYSNRTELKIYVKIVLETPNSIHGPNQTLYFGADRLTLDADGGFVGDTRLVLLGDVPIYFGEMTFLLKGGLNASTNTFLDLTYVSIDCDGFKELKITGDLMFPSNKIIAIDRTTGSPLANKQVKSRLETVA